MKIAWRNVMKNKVFSFINVFGLAIGLTCCLLISMYLYKEFSYDSYHTNADRLYQLGTISIVEGKEDRFPTTPAPMAPTMQQEYGEIDMTARLMRLFQDDKTLLRYTDGKEVRAFYEQGGYMADSTFFRMFTYSFIEGDARTALDDPSSVVISKEIAKKIFGNEPALNKIIHINSTTNGAYDFKVSGVFETSTIPSHIDARFFLSLQSGEAGQWVRSLTDMANNNMFFSYLLLKPGVDPKKLESKFDAFVRKYAGEDLKAQGRGRKQFLTRVPDVHLFANTNGNVTPPGSVSYLYILASIAIVTLLIACVNFMNLSTARSSKRAVEIGVRKVLGAERGSLIRQFLLEAVLLSLLAYILSIGFTFLLQPLFEQLAGKSFHFSSSQYLFIFLAFLGVALLAGVVAGIYPAFYLSAFQPVRVLKGRFTNSLAAISFRKVLVVFQFVISAALIVASITISNQMRYLRDRDPGFEKEQQIIIPLRTSTAKEIYPTLRDRLMQHPSITFAGASAYYPGIENVTDWLLYKQGTQPDQTRTIFMNFVDHSYLQALGIKPVAGRIFSQQFPADTANRMIINEQAVRDFGFTSPEDAIGKNLASNWGDSTYLFQIVGVVHDFNFKGFQSKIEAYGFLLRNYNEFTYLLANTRGSDVASALNAIQGTWGEMNPNEPFEYSFLDDDFQKNYIAEERLATIIRYLTLIAIFISCLGLFGLTTFSVEQRTKEIGVRKVLGASVFGIVTLLSRDFLKLVLISFLLASPIAWYFVHKWLEGFAYRTNFSVWMLIVGWMVTFIVAFLTISIQAVRAALANPVKNLRTE